MAARGPAPEPPSAKLARGETRPSRVNYEAPLPPDTLGDPPSDMSEDAKKVWRRVRRAMRSTHVLTSADVDVLRVYCETIVRYHVASKMLAGSTPLLAVSRRRGEVIRNPLNAICRDLSDTIRLYARELGLTPSARASLRLDATAPTADMDALIGPPPRLRVVGE